MAFELDELIQQSNRYFQNNNWIAIIRLLEPHCEPTGEGWNHAALLRQLGFAYTQQNQLAKALRCYRQWSELEPDRAAPYYCQGYVFYLEKKWQQAISCFEQRWLFTRIIWFVYTGKPEHFLKRINR